MSDEPRVVRFERPPPPTPSFRALSPPGGLKYGLFALGPEDVVLSLALLNALLRALEEGTAEERAQLAATIRGLYTYPFQP